MMITQWAGINVITSYMVTIFTESGSSVEPELAPIFVCGVQQLLALVSTLVLRVSPRKPLFLFCALIVVIINVTGMNLLTGKSLIQAMLGGALVWMGYVLLVRLVGFLFFNLTHTSN